MQDFIILIISFFISIILGTLIFWGLGNLIVFVFKINYEWTFLHGLVVQLVFMILRNIFKK